MAVASGDHSLREEHDEGESEAERAPERPSLAPEPDFRHVSLLPRARTSLTSMLSTGASAGLASIVGVAPWLGLRQAAWVGALGATVAAATAALRARRPFAKRESGRAVAMSIVPWGVIVDEGVQTRVLRWGAIARVHVETCYGRDQATDVTNGSIVVVETAQERLVGLASDAVPLERLLAHREAYAREAEHVASIDLEGVAAAGESWEPQVERLLLTARQLLGGGGGGHSVAASLLGYRGRRTSLPSEEVAIRLREVLRDRCPHERDPRPLSAMLAAELGMISLAQDLVPLVSSPHALTAATARAAGLALGLPKSCVGVLDEVAPFLPEADVEALSCWSLRRETMGASH